MNLRSAPTTYDKGDQDRLRSEINNADRQNLKRGQEIEVGDGRIVVRSPNGNRWILGVSNAGATTWTAL